MGERWGTRCFPAFSSCSLPQIRKHEKTHADWRKTSVNYLFCPWKTPENIKKRDVQSLENGVEHPFVMC